MQDQAPKTAKTATTTTTPPPGRSSVAKLPAELRKAVDRAIADGATIDEITARIRAEGESCSRSAVGRYTKDMRGLMHTRQEADRIVKLWMQEYGEQPQDELALVLIQSLRAMVLATMEHMTEREEPVPMQELDRLTRVLKRIEDTDKLRLARERAAQKEAEAAKPKPTSEPKPKPKPKPKLKPKRRKGLSPEMVARIDEAVLGKARWPVGPDGSVPVGPLNPGESHLSPEKLAEMYPEIAPRVYRTSPTSILSLGPAPPAPKTREPAAGARAGKEPEPAP